MVVFTLKNATVATVGTFPVAVSARADLVRSSRVKRESTLALVRNYLAQQWVASRHGADSTSAVATLRLPLPAVVSSSDDSVAPSSGSPFDLQRQLRQRASVARNFRRLLGNAALVALVEGLLLVAVSLVAPLVSVSLQPYKLAQSNAMSWELLQLGAQTSRQSYPLHSSYVPSLESLALVWMFLLRHTDVLVVSLPSIRFISRAGLTLHCHWCTAGVDRRGAPGAVVVHAALRPKQAQSCSRRTTRRRHLHITPTRNCIWCAIGANACGCYACNWHRGRSF